MKLIPISSNVLVNIESIDCVEQKVTKGSSLTYIWIGNKSYILEIPLEEFYKSLEESVPIVQNFAG